MTKTELIKKVAQETELTKKDVEKVVETVISTITDTVVAGEAVKITGFGTFETRERSAKMGRNPKTNEPLEIPATTVPVFKASKVFKGMVVNG